MKLEYLKQAATILTNCGRPELPGGLVAVPIPKAFVMPILTPVSSNPTASTFTKEITGETVWELRAISVDQRSFRSTSSGNPVRLQIQLPNGRFLFGGNGIDLTDFAWLGSWRWPQDPEYRFQPGDKINVTVTSSITSVVINLLFEGAYLYFMRNGEAVPSSFVDLASLPRYDGSVNENIMAPAWMSNEAVDTPAGYRDDYFVYSTPGPASDTDPLAAYAISIAGAVTSGPQLFSVPIDPGYDFSVRRMLFDVQFTGGVDGAAILGRIRTGAGQALSNTFIDLAHYLCGAEFGGRFKVKGGDSIYIDAVLVDPHVTGFAEGTVTFQAHFEGFRRSRIK